MNLTLFEVLKQAVYSPILLTVFILVAGVIFVNGWTDAPNAITACVSTGVMEVNSAIRMAAIFNFAGMLFMSIFHSGVAYTIYHMVDFGDDKKAALTGLCAALTAIILWAVAAWWFGIPTSESHALIAGLTGAALAIRSGLEGICLREWCKVLWGLVLSVLLGYVLGFSFTLFLRLLTGKKKNIKGHDKFFSKAQIAGAASMAFMHGAQDGQKFMGVFMLGICLFKGWEDTNQFTVPFWMIVMCSVLMAAGTCVGGKRIIQKVGSEMVHLEKDQGFSADAAGSVCLLLATAFGLPVSTTHVKTTAMVGAAGVGEGKSADKGIVRQMLAAWILTFPACGLIGYLAAKLFLILFL